MFDILDSLIATAEVVLGLSLVVQALQQIFKQWLELKAEYMLNSLQIIGDILNFGRLPAGIVISSDGTKMFITTQKDGKLWGAYSCIVFR